jgi:hypothetical protein
MNLMDYFGGGNAAGGMRMPQMGTGMDLYGGQPSSNLGLSMPSNPYATDMGTGIKPPSSFGQMPAGFDLQSALTMAGSLLGKQEEQQKSRLRPAQLPMGSGQSYEDLIKMYGVRSGGLLG